MFRSLGILKLANFKSGTDILGFSVYLKSLIALWKSYRLKLWLSIFCIAVAVFDTTVISLSPVAAGALFIAIVPWVLGYIERVAVPGGFEIVLKDAERKLDQSNALPDTEDLEAFEHFKSDDPNLAIALLRVEIERRLRKKALDVLPDSSKHPKSLRALTEELRINNVITNDAAALLFDLLPIMNEAVHGISLRRDATEFTIKYGPKLLAQLR